MTPVLVDLARHAVPVSATQVRQDAWAIRRHLPDAVWADWVPRVCLLGGESSGKSTLAAALAAHHGGEPVAEYGRELWMQQGGRLQEADLLRIAQVQQAREDEAATRASRLPACDTSALTTLFYSLDQFGRADAELVERARRPYRLHVPCEPDFPFVQDGTRRGEAFRQQQHAWYLRESDERGLPMLRVSGSVTDRVRQVDAALGLGKSTATHP